MKNKLFIPALLSLFLILASSAGAAAQEKAKPLNTGKKSKPAIVRSDKTAPAAKPSLKSMRPKTPAKKVMISREQATRSAPAPKNQK